MPTARAPKPAQPAALDHTPPVAPADAGSGDLAEAVQAHGVLDAAAALDAADSADSADAADAADALESTDMAEALEGPQAHDAPHAHPAEAAPTASATAAPPPATRPEPQPRYRIGAVARMLRMPVATLRVWERRYQVTRPETSASGHRLYCAAEVQRLALLRQLVSLGHAVGALAHLDMAGLHAVAATHARAVAQPVPVLPLPGSGPTVAATASSTGTSPSAQPRPSAMAAATGGGDSSPVAAEAPGAGRSLAAAAGGTIWPEVPGPGQARQDAESAGQWPSAVAASGAGQGIDAAARPLPGLLLLGDALIRRLARPAWQRWLASRWQVLATWPGLEQAGPADRPGHLPGAAAGSARRHTALLASVPSLQADQVAALAALAQQWQAGPVLVLYRYAGPGARAALQAAGLACQAHPSDDAGWQGVVQDWLESASAPPPGAFPVADAPAAFGAAAPLSMGAAGDSLPEAPPRRYTDATLTDLAALSTTIACECPAHVAELLMSLSHFEAYSAECAHRSPTDAAMHQHLQRVAGTARALFEQALARLAVHEGLILPDAAAAG